MQSFGTFALWILYKLSLDEIGSSNSAKIHLALAQNTIGGIARLGVSLFLLFAFLHRHYGFFVFSANVQAACTTKNSCHITRNIRYWMLKVSFFRQNGQVELCF